MPWRTLIEGGCTFDFVTKLVLYLVKRVFECTAQLHFTIRVVDLDVHIGALVLWRRARLHCDHIEVNLQHLQSTLLVERLGRNVSRAG